MTNLTAPRINILAPKLIISLGLAAACTFATAVTDYQFTRFEDPRGSSTNFFPAGINNAQVVAGTASFQRGFTLSGASITLFDFPGVNNATFADDINNSGVVVGTYRIGTTGARGFTLANGSFSTIAVPGVIDTFATGINDSGQVVGQYRQPGTGKISGYLLSGGDFSFFDASQFQPDTFANGINNAGRVVGSIGGGGTNSRGFAYEGGVFEFFDVPGAVSTQAFGVNNLGHIVGSSSAGVFVKSGSDFTILTLPSSWNAGQATATDITDDGVVVGYLTDNTTNLTYGFLATPIVAIPEPSSAALLLFGALAIVARRKATRR
jgi:hypothetical protein